MTPSTNRSARACPRRIGSSGRTRTNGLANDRVASVVVACVQLDPVAVWVTKIDEEGIRNAVAAQATFDQPAQPGGELATGTKDGNRRGNVAHPRPGRTRAANRQDLFTPSLRIGWAPSATWITSVLQ